MKNENIITNIIQRDLDVPLHKTLYFLIMLILVKFFITNDVLN